MSTTPGAAGFRVAASAGLWPGAFRGVAAARALSDSRCPRGPPQMAERRPIWGPGARELLRTGRVETFAERAGRAPVRSRRGRPEPGCAAEPAVAAERPVGRRRRFWPKWNSPTACWRVSGRADGGGDHRQQRQEHDDRAHRRPAPGGGLPGRGLRQHRHSAFRSRRRTARAGVCRRTLELPARGDRPVSSAGGGASEHQPRPPRPLPRRGGGTRPRRRASSAIRRAATRSAVVNGDDF